MVHLSYPYITTGKTIALTRCTFVGKVPSLLFKHLQSWYYASKRFLPFPGRIQQPGGFSRSWRGRQDPLRLPLTGCSALLSPSAPKGFLASITRLGLEIASKSEGATAPLLFHPQPLSGTYQEPATPPGQFSGVFFFLRFYLFIFGCAGSPLAAASGHLPFRDALGTGAQLGLLGGTGVFPRPLPGQADS